MHNILLPGAMRSRTLREQTSVQSVNGAIVKMIVQHHIGFNKHVCQRRGQHIRYTLQTDDQSLQGRGAKGGSVFVFCCLISGVPILAGQDARAHRFHHHWPRAGVPRIPRRACAVRVVAAKRLDTYTVRTAINHR